MVSVGDRLCNGLDFVFVEPQQRLAPWAWKPELKSTDLTMSVGDDTFVDLGRHLHFVEVEVVVACTAYDRKCVARIR